MDRPTPTVSDLVRTAVDAVDPEGSDEGVGRFYGALEDDDRPVTAVDNLEEHLAMVEDSIDHDVSDPGVTLVVAVVLFLASRGGSADYDRDPDELIRLAVRAQWHGDPPDEVSDWLEGGEG
jgi:hypothetical protein